MRVLIATTLAGAMLCGATVAASAATPQTRAGAHAKVEKVQGRECVRGFRTLHNGKVVRCGPRHYRNPKSGVHLYVAPGARGSHNKQMHGKHEFKRADSSHKAAGGQRKGGEGARKAGRD